MRKPCYPPTDRMRVVGSPSHPERGVVPSGGISPLSPWAVGTRRADGFCLLPKLNMMFFNKSKKRYFCEFTRGRLLMKLAWVKVDGGKEIVMDLYRPKKFGLYDRFAELRFSELTLLQALFADADRRVKDLMRIDMTGK
jgi:hypothetical protein